MYETIENIMKNQDARDEIIAQFENDSECVPDRLAGKLLSSN